MNNMNNMAEEMEIPPHYTFAAQGEGRVPKPAYEEEEDPFDALARASATDDGDSSDDAISPSTVSSFGRYSMSRSSSSRATPLTTTVPIRRPLVTAQTFPTSNYDPWATVRASRALETANYASTLSPEYVPIDEHVRTFRLQAPFIYTTKTSNLPRYQIQQEFDRAGKPVKLNIRRLRPNETRSCSVSAIHAARGPRIRYDEEGTMYSISIFEMRGKKESAAADSVEMSSGKTLWGGHWTRLWHVKHPRRSDSHISKISSDTQRIGRRSIDEADKRLLFAVKKGVWEDTEGMTVAREEKGWGYGDRLLSRRGSGASANGKILEMTDFAPKEEAKRDLLVACWVMRIWMSEGIRWEGDIKGW